VAPPWQGQWKGLLGRLPLRSRAGESDAPDPKSFRSLLHGEIGAEHLAPRLRIGFTVDAGLPDFLPKSCDECVASDGECVQGRPSLSTVI
jgi:hypothetical protein